MKHTILGGGGAIGLPLAKSLKTIYHHQVRIVGRKPEKVNNDDEIMAADLLDAAAAHRVVKGSAVAYLCAGLPYKSSLWKRDWPVLMRNVIDACKAHDTKLVFVDNVYMYAPQALPDMTERSAIGPVSKKGKVRRQLANMLMEEAAAGNLRMSIARCADFYGPAIRNGILQELALSNLKKGKPAMWLCDTSKVHSFTYTPDAARAIALLGNDNRGDNRVWHMPTAGDKLTGMDWVRLLADELNTRPRVFVLKRWMLKSAGAFVPLMREIEDTCYQYQHDYFFNSSDFERSFGIAPTPVEQAIGEIIAAEPD